MSEFKDLQPEVCEIPDDQPPQKLCPTCKPDPNYIEPTWWTTSEPYLNKKICEYQINMVSTKSITGVSDNVVQYEARRLVKKGIREILRKLGKLETNDIVCAFPPNKKKQKCRLYIPPNLLIKLELEELDRVQIKDNIVYNKQDPEDRFNPDSLEVAAKVADIYYGDNFELFQVLVSVPAEAINAVPQNPFDNDDRESLEEEAEATEEIILDGYDFRGNIRKIRAAMMLYSKYQSVFSYTQGIKLVQDIDSNYVPFYLKKYRQYLEAFKELLRDVAKENGYKITSVKSRRTVEKIKIRFRKDEPLKIKSIFVKKKGCPYEKLRGIRQLKNVDTTTMNYIVNLEKMVEDLSFQEDVPWLDFVVEYTYPALLINFGDIDNNEEPLNSCLDQESVDQYKDRILQSLLTFSEAIQFSLTTKNCKTLQDLKDFDPMEQERFNLKESLKKRKKKRQERRQSRSQSNATVGDIEATIETLTAIETTAQASQTIDDIVRLKKEYYNLSSEDDEMKSLKLEKKILMSTSRDIDKVIRELEKRFRDIEEDEMTTIEEKQILKEQNSDKIDKLKAENFLISSDIGMLQDRIDELRSENKDTRKKDRKEASSVTWDKVKDLYEEAYETKRKEIKLTDSLFNKDKKDRGDDKFELMDLIRGLNPCRWDRVNMQILECLLGGMSFADAIPLIIKAALKNISPYVLEDLLIGLPMEERKAVSEQLKVELSKISTDLAEDFQEPWDAQKEKESLEEKADSSFENQSILDANKPTVTGDFDKNEKRAEIAAQKKSLKKFKKQLRKYLKQHKELEEAEETPEQFLQLVNLENNLIPDTEAEIERIEKELENLFGEFKKQQATSTPVISNATGIIFDAYVQAIVDSLSIDRLTAMLDDIPGANIFKKLILEASCPRTNNLKSNVKDLFGTISIELCEPGSKNYFLPAIPDLPVYRGIGLHIAIRFMLNNFKSSLGGLIAEIILALIMRALDLIENGLCNSIGVLGALLANSLVGQTGKSGFYDAVNDAFCENEAAKEDTANDLLGRAGIPTLSRPEIANALSSAATKDEIKQALISDCEDQNPKVMKAIWAVFKASGLRLNDMFQSPDDVRDMFCMIGSYLTPEQRRLVELSLGRQDVPVNNNICLTNKERELWDKNRNEFYINQGLDPESARKFVDGLNKKMNRDLADVLDNLSRGPDGLIGDALREALTPRDPNCDDATNSLIPPMPQEMKEIMKSISEGVFGSLAYTFTADLIGKGDSFFDNILADMEGIRLSYGLFSHERRVGFDLLWPNASNTEKDHAKKFDEADGTGKAWMRIASDGVGKPDPNYLFPATIGIYFHQRLLEMTEQEFSMTTEKDGKRKLPDLLLKYRNVVPDDEDLEFDFGFNLAYNHFRYPDRHIKSDEYSIRKLDIVKSTDSTSRSIDLRINSKHGVNEYKQILDKYDMEESSLSMPYVAQLFGEVIKDRYSKAGATNLKPKSIEKMYNTLNDLIYKKLMTALTVDARDPNDLPAGYIFGYRDDNKVAYNDLLYVNPEADPEDPETWEYTYEEEDAVLGKSATENKRVKFLDPAKYGGKYTKPKLYVEQADHDGWFNITKMMIPEIDGCAPKRTDFLFLDEISEKVSELQSSIQTDKRYELEPDCVYEPAYDKLLPADSHAYIEGIIKATVRAYSLESLLRTMPVLSHLRLDFDKNYSNIFLDFIVEKMEDTMQEQGSWPRRIRDYKYWTAFLDQVVQSSFRMLGRGDLDNDPELVELLQKALDVSKNYSRPTLEDKRLLFLVKKYSTNERGRIVDVDFIGVDVPNKRKRRIVKLANALAYEAFGKDFQKELLGLKSGLMKLKTLRLQELKDAERNLDIHDNIELAKKILRFHIIQELKKYSEKLDEAMIPQTYIADISKFLLGASKTAVVSDTNAGLSEIERPIGESALPNYGEIPSVPSNNRSPFLNLTSEEIEQTKLSGGLFLQKYIRVTSKELELELPDGPTVSIGGESSIGIEGMVSFSQFRDAINNFTGDKTKYISEVLGNAIAIPELGTYDGTIGVKMGVRVCYVLPEGIDPFSSSEETLEAARAINEDKCYFTNDENGINYFIPLAHYEQDIVDRKIEDINTEDEDFDEEIKCYFDRMVETDEFKFIFNTLLMTKNVPSIAAIYAYDGFINSIGLGDDEREKGKHGSNRNSLGMEIGWEGKILDDTKKRLLDLFSSYYLTHEKSKDQKQQREKDRKQFLKNLLPDSLFNFDRNVRWWQLRRLQNRPFDKDGNDCASTLADIFKGEEE